MKRIIKVIFLILGVLLAYGCVNFFTLSDLKPDRADFPNSQAKAKELLAEMGKAHGIEVAILFKPIMSLLKMNSMVFWGNKVIHLKNRK